MVNAVGYVICRLRSRFGNVLTGEFPVSWGMAAEAIVYPTKGDAQRIRARLTGEKTVVMGVQAEFLTTPNDGRGGKAV